MLAQQLVVLGNIPVVEIGNAQIEKNKKEKRKVENGEVQPVFFGTYQILHLPVDAKNPQWLYQKVKKNEQ